MSLCLRKIGNLGEGGWLLAGKAAAGRGVRLHPPGSASADSSAPAQRFYLYRNIYGTSRRQPGKGSAWELLKAGRNAKPCKKIQRVGWAFCVLKK